MKLTIQLPAIHSFKGKKKISSGKWYEVASLRGDSGAFYFTDKALMRAAEALAQCQPPELIKFGNHLTGLEKQKTTSLPQAANSQAGLSH